MLSGVNQAGKRNISSVRIGALNGNGIYACIHRIFIEKKTERQFYSLLPEPFVVVCSVGIVGFKDAVLNGIAVVDGDLSGCEPTHRRTYG